LIFDMHGVSLLNYSLVSHQNICKSMVSFEYFSLYNHVHVSEKKTIESTSSKYGSISPTQSGKGSSDLYR